MGLGRAPGPWLQPASLHRLAVAWDDTVDSISSWSTVAAAPEHIPRSGTMPPVAVTQPQWVNGSHSGGMDYHSGSSAVYARVLSSTKTREQPGICSRCQKPASCTGVTIEQPIAARANTAGGTHAQGLHLTVPALHGWSWQCVAVVKATMQLERGKRIAWRHRDFPSTFGMHSMTPRKAVFKLVIWHDLVLRQQQVWHGQGRQRCLHSVSRHTMCCVQVGLTKAVGLDLGTSLVFTGD